MTNTPPTNLGPETPHQLAVLIANITYAMCSIELPPLPGEPGFEEYLNNQALLQQLNLAMHFQIALDVDPMNQVAAAGLLKALALIEKSRTRVTRPTKPDKAESAKTPTERDFAAEFLKAELLPGPRRVEDLMTRARLMGITARTLQRAKLDLNIASNLHVMPDKERFWSWSLPEHAHFANHNPPKPRPECTISDAEYIALKEERDAYYAAQPPVSDDLGGPIDSDLRTQPASSSSTLSTPVSNLSTQNSALGTSVSKAAILT